MSNENKLIISCFNKKDHYRGDLNPSLFIDMEKGEFKCWACGIHGNFSKENPPKILGA